MDQNTERLLLALDDQIERKCFEIRRNKADKRLRRIFMYACVLFLVLPLLLAFAGVSLVALCVPAAVYLSVGLFAAAPLILISNKGGVSL